jgi:hypothetical protein
MLKIKDNVDLKELEKYGLKSKKYYSCDTGELLWNNYYIDDPFCSHIIFVYGKNRHINREIYNHLSKAYYCPDSDIVTPAVADTIESILFNLINDGLVEKVVE